ncbi:hypothetical protein BGZ51_002721 [Haplosporangium sp. Z 767]|nr:hypothetical protein BGZ50_003205 [Haplosporangium sp. Z 11]KAF9185333.1 hypothetical protein BGZ51_002721 [Haplosporangium sp. Z 767]
MDPLERYKKRPASRHNFQGHQQQQQSISITHPLQHLPVMSRTFDNNARATLNESIHRQDSTFKLQYFKLHGLASCARLILATSGAKWESTFPEDWANVEKKDTLFGCLPVLYETTSTGQHIEVPETDAIEHYLAKKFKLYGDDDFDEIKVRAFATSTQSLVNFLILRVLTVSDAEYKAKMMERFQTEALPQFVAVHERHLEANGRNGYYVGNKLSLAEIKLAVALGLVLAVTGDKFVSKEATPALWTAWETVNAIPSYVEWRKTEIFAQLEESNKRLLGL